MSKALKQRSSGNISGAIKSFKEAWDGADNPVQKNLALLMLGDCQLEDKRYTDAVNSFRQLSKMTKTDEERAEALSGVPAPLQLSDRVVAKVLYRECRGVESDAEKAAVAWCILNRVDSGERYFPDTVIEVVTQKNQFAYYEDTPVWSNLYFLAEDVLTRWHNEKCGDKDVGRTLPKEYLYFTGDGKHNNFTVEWLGKDYWDWSLDSPYED